VTETEFAQAAAVGDRTAVGGDIDFEARLKGQVFGLLDLDDGAIFFEDPVIEVVYLLDGLGGAEVLGDRGEHPGLAGGDG